MRVVSWRTVGVGAMAVGAAAGIWAALQYGNRYLDEFENTRGDENACGEFFTTSAGWRIHYTVQGEGTPVVLIHGFMDSLQTWRRNAHVLADAHRVYAIDVLGFGASDRVRAPIYTLKQQARFLREFFAAQEIENADVVGHSMGGALALQFAYDFPELVHKLVLIAPATFLYAALPRNGLSPVPRSVSRGVLGLYEKWQGERANPVRLAYGDPARITPDSIEPRRQMMRVRGTHDALISMSKSKREADVPQQLKQVRMPTLIVWGKRDHVVPGRHAAWHYRELPNARLEWIETAGHLPHEEEPEAVNELLREFLNHS
jgi:pimeloyl-ACP methyl ester carboxylesterase